MAKEWTNGFYLSKAWRKTRDAYYQYRRGVCERCEQELREGSRTLENMNPGIIVHHKKHLNKSNINDPAIALSFDNLELLCDMHHNRHHKAKSNRYSFGRDGRIIPSHIYSGSSPPGV